MRGISANVMCGQEGLFGTASFQIVLNMNEMLNLEEQTKYEYEDKEKYIEEGLFKGIEDDADACSTKNLTIETNVTHIKTEQLGDDDDYNPF
jgi:DNA-directed RNA polymerase II subunit RPB1